MKSKPKPVQQRSLLFPSLVEQCDPRQPLKKLADAIPWEQFEDAFSEYYSEVGRPAKPIRLMVGLLLLKQLEDLSDEVVVARWVRDPYFQYFCGMTEFQWELPCNPTDLVHFRNRIGEEGVHLIFAVITDLHRNRIDRESEILVDTTVQEKNITFPTDTKLHSRIIARCWRMADKYGIRLRRRYRKELRQCLLSQRWRRHPGKAKIARKAQKRIKTIAGILLRELDRKLPRQLLKAHLEEFKLYLRVLNQQKSDKNKVYSLHEPQTYCIAKGKENKTYEYGSKASVAVTADTGIIVSVVAHPKNIYDGHTLPEVLELAEAVMGKRPAKAIVDRGYRGEKQIDGTDILSPENGKAEQSKSEKAKMRKRFRKRSGIEAIISHLKHDFRLLRCYLKGSLGDTMNLLLAACAWNLKKWMATVSFCQIRRHCSQFEGLDSLLRRLSMNLSNDKFIVGLRFRL